MSGSTIAFANTKTSPLPDFSSKVNTVAPRLQIGTNCPPVVVVQSAATDEARSEMNGQNPKHPTASQPPNGTLVESATQQLPLWDGLSDERGPIPAFGPAHTNEIGQILMSDQEREARRDAAIRALDAIGKITDETDTDEVWAEVFRGLEGAS